jgi:cytidylate kinase
MEPKGFVVDQFVKEQVDKWKKRATGGTEKAAVLFPVITLATEPGSGGRVIAAKVAEKIQFDFFHRDIVNAIAENAKMSRSVVDSLERERLTGIEDFLSSLVKEKYLYPGDYLRHLMRVVSTISRHGRAVIVGRGANFILPPDKRFSVRVIAPLEVRVKNVARGYKTSLEEAEKRVIRRESKRRAFIRQSFHTDISDPLHYDAVLNTGQMSVDSAVAAIVGAVRGGNPAK